MDGNSSLSRLNTSTFPLLHPIIFRVYRPAASTIKTQMFCYVRMGQSSSSIRPKRFVYQRLKLCGEETDDRCVSCGRQAAGYNYPPEERRRQWPVCV